MPFYVGNLNLETVPEWNALPDECRQCLVVGTVQENIFLFTMATVMAVGRYGSSPDEATPIYDFLEWMTDHVHEMVSFK